jgi:hypothetical protein
MWPGVDMRGGTCKQVPGNVGGGVGWGGASSPCAQNQPTHIEELPIDCREGPEGEWRVCGSVHWSMHANDAANINSSWDAHTIPPTHDTCIEDDSLAWPGAQMRQCVHALHRKEHIELTSRMNSQCMLSDAPHPLICDPIPCETDVGVEPHVRKRAYGAPTLSTRFMQRACATSAALQYSNMCDMWHALNNMPEHKHKFAQRAPTARARWPDHSCVAVSC